MVTRFWTYAWKNTSTLPTLIFDLSDHPFIKDNIFEFDVNLAPIGTPIDIATQYCEHHNMSYISQLKKNSPRNHFFPSRNTTNFWILGIGRKEPTTFHFVLESISSQQLIGKCNRVHVITFRRYKDIIRTNLQGNICTFNQIRHIHYIEEKLSSLRTKLPTPYHIGDVVKKFLRSEWYYSIFQSMRKWQHPQHSVHHFYLRYYHQTQRYSDP